MGTLLLACMAVAPTPQADLYPVEVGYAWHYSQTHYDFVAGHSRDERWVVRVTGREWIELDGGRVEAFVIVTTSANVPDVADASVRKPPDLRWRASPAGTSYAVVDDRSVRLYAGGELSREFPRAPPRGGRWTMGVAPESRAYSVQEEGGTVVFRQSTACRHCETPYFMLAPGVGLINEGAFPDPASGARAQESGPVVLERFEGPVVPDAGAAPRPAEAVTSAEPPKPSPSFRWPNLVPDLLPPTTMLRRLTDLELWGITGLMCVMLLAVLVPRRVKRPPVRAAAPGVSGALGAAIGLLLGGALGVWSGISPSGAATMGQAFAPVVNGFIGAFVGLGVGAAVAGLAGGPRSSVNLLALMGGVLIAVFTSVATAITVMASALALEKYVQLPNNTQPFYALAVVTAAATLGVVARFSAWVSKPKREQPQ